MKTTRQPIIDALHFLPQVILPASGQSIDTMIRPRYFRFFSWAFVPSSEAMDGNVPLSMSVGSKKALPFKIHGPGRKWEDVIPFGKKDFSLGHVQLFSEKVVSAFQAEEIRGITFYPAEIAKIDRTMSPTEPCPKYYWAQFKGRINYDHKLEDKEWAYHPVNVAGGEESDFFHLCPDDGPRKGAVWFNCACSFKVVEACRKHDIGNLHITPIDLSFGGPFWNWLDRFRIDLFGDVWPPLWYPEGVRGDPANQIDDLEPVDNAAPMSISVPFDYLNRLGGVAARWAEPHPIDKRSAGLQEPADWRNLRMAEEDVADVEIELRVVIPDFLRAWLIENPFSECTSDTRALKCQKDHLICDNVKHRRDGYYGREWPEHLLCIGDDWGGGAYFVDTSEKEPAVYWYDWEQGEGDTVLPIYSTRLSPEQFVRDILDIPPEE